MERSDKLVEDLEAARVETQQRDDLLDRGEDLLPAPVVEALRDESAERRSQLLDAIRAIFERQTLSVSQLGLPARETRALEALRTAVEGRSERGEFVYAEDRRDLLERALGVLQPGFAQGGGEISREIGAQLSGLSERVAGLRESLDQLEDAQDELVEAQQKAGQAHDAKPPAGKPPAVPSDLDAPRPTGTRSGTAVAREARPASALLGPEGDEEAAEETGPPSTLLGPEGDEEAAEEARPASTLLGPEGDEEAAEEGDEDARPSTLIGRADEADVAEAARPPSSLGSAEDLALAERSGDTEPAGRARRPWWRRPFG